MKKKKLSNFDFSVAGAHVALVSRAANGKETPLIVKKLDPVEKGEYHEGDDETQNGAMVEMSLADFLSCRFGVWGYEARLIANSIKKAAETDPEYAELLKSIPQEVLEEDPVRHAPNNLEEVSMSEIETTPEQVAGVQKAAETQALEKSLVEKDEIIKSMQSKLKAFEEAEEIRKAAKYGAMAQKYAPIGADESTAEILKAFDGVEGFDKIVEMLDNAVATLEKQDLLEPVGVEGEQVVVKSVTELQDIAKVLMDQDKTLTIQKALVLAAQRNPHLVK